jgi:hypothetical protein
MKRHYLPQRLAHNGGYFACSERCGLSESYRFQVSAGELLGAMVAGYGVS